jgi:hypothetical protein
LFHDNVVSPQQKPKKRAKFDVETKRQLTEMNLYLKRSYAVECLPETQLVNDKKLLKENSTVIKPSNLESKAIKSTRQHLETVKRKLVADITTSTKRSSMDSVRVVIHEQRQDVDTEWPEDGDRHDERRTSTSHDKENLQCLSPQFHGSIASGFSPSDVRSEASSLQNEQQKSWLAAFREKQATGAASLLDQSTDSHPEQNEHDDGESSSRESVMSNDGPRTSLLDTVMEDEQEVSSQKERDTPRSLSGQKRRMAEPKAMTREPSTTTGTVPWANVKLRSCPKPTNQTSKQHDTSENPSSLLEHHLESSAGGQQGRTSSSSLSSLSRSSQEDETRKPEMPPWMVKLKSVQKAQTQESTSDAGSDDCNTSDVLAFRKQLRKVPSELNAAKKKEMESTQGVTKLPEQKSLADLSWKPASEPVSVKPRKSVVCGIVRGDDIDLSNLPQDVFGDESHVGIIDLDRIPGMPEEHKLSVVVGKNMLLEARTVQGARMSRVNWRVPRSDVKSIALDMADRRADIVLNDRKSKSLIFGSAEGCLRFANIFYEPAKQNRASLLDDDDETSTLSPVVDDSEAAAASVPVPEAVTGSPALSQGLTEEEQQLLEAFRQKRKTKSSAEALKESMAVLQSDWDDADKNEAGSESAAQSSLSKEEEKIAEKYRKMLKMRIPPEAVQHKMTKDGVADNIVASVLAEPGQESGTPTEGLSEEEEKIAETYRKMLKLRIPPEAVQHKMAKDQVDARIVTAVLGTLSTTESKSEKSDPPSLSEEEEKLASSYRKMLKMMIPPEAVKHKMKKDQASNNVIVAVFGPDAIESSAKEKQESVVALSAEEEAIASSYRKMLKMMIPPEAVRHKMKKDQVDSKIVLVVLGEDPSEEVKSKKIENSLSEADEQIAESYRKMLRMKVPRDGVRHKMVKNNVGEHIIDAVLGAGSMTKSKCKQGTISTKKSSGSGSKLVSLHWTPLSGEELNNSVWRVSKKRKMAVAQPEGSDISKLVELFQKKTNKKVVSAGDGAGSNGSGDDMAKLIDLNRANNLAISLKAFKDFSHIQLAETIAHLDPLQRITGERVQFMKDLLPTPTEVKVIKAYKGSETRLVPAELFFTKMVKISRLQTKVQVMQTMDTLNDNATELGQNFILLETVCSQIMNSEKLEEVLDMVLQIGNIMNEGTRTGGAAGFKFDSLLKLTQTKSSDGKMTVLDYIVMIFVAKDKRETLHLTDDFPECQAAGRMLITEMVNDVNNMKAALKKCETELENLKKDNGEVPSAVEESDPRAALMAALKKKAACVEEPKKPKNLGNRDAFLAAIEARKPPEPSEVDGKLQSKQEQDPPSEKAPFVAKDASLKSGIERLEAFIADSKNVLGKLEDERDRAIDACKSLSRYCGESGGERATASLIGILSQFAMNLEAAVKKHDERKEAEKRREAAAQKKKEQGLDTSFQAKPLPSKTPKKPTDPTTKGQSLVLMVNELLREAPAEAKEDFKNGVVYVDPDDKLRAIYKKERESLGIFVPPDARKPSQVDLLIAIKKRRERADARRENSITSTEAQKVAIATDNRGEDKLSQGCSIGDCSLR